MDHTNCLQVAIKTLQFDLFENKQDHEEALKSANFELVKQGVHFTCSQCGLHSSPFDYDEYAHSTSNFDDETVAHEIYAGSSHASAVRDTSIVVGISTSLQGYEEEEEEAGARM
jgi:hypothetical protein